MNNKRTTRRKQNNRTQKRAKYRVRGKKQSKTIIQSNTEPNETKAINCSPIVKGKNIAKDSCYTADALMKIKDAYNKNNGPQDQILETDPTKVYNILRSRLTRCKKEDCWLEEIKDSKVRQQLDQILFAPDQPREWKDNPTEWLSNYDIEKVLQQYEIAYPEFKLLGPSSIDYDTEVNGSCVWDDICRMQLKDLMARKKRKLGIVFNLDKHNEPGSHWVSMFVDLDNKFIFYFDSALNPVPTEIKRLKQTIMKQGLHLNPPIEFKYIVNKKAHQRSNTECGMYTLYFIISMLTGREPGNDLKKGGDDNNYDNDKTVVSSIDSYKPKSRSGGNTENLDMINTFRDGSLPDVIMIEERKRLFNPVE